MKKTALNSVFHELGAKLVEFAGWEMPVIFSNIKDEHMAVRTAAGVFDVSHMGEIEITGPDAFMNVQRLTPNNVKKLAVGQAHYSSLLYPQATFVDDILVYNRGENHYMLCVNCANTDKDYGWILENIQGNVKVENISDNITQLAIQGPKSISILQHMTEVDLSGINYYHFVEERIAGVHGIISRTGYTGEDGFELYIDPGDSEKVWRKLFEYGRDYGLQPAGLGARDTLRLEASMALYGNDIDDTTTPLEAGLQWTVKLKKGEFIGRDVLLKQKEEGLKRCLVGFRMTGKGIPRHDYVIRRDGKDIGKVTSGTIGYVVGETIGMGYVEIGHSEPGTGIEIIIRGRPVDAEIVSIPFYKRDS